MKDPLDTHLGQRLQMARTQKGMTVAELASAIGAQVSELEKYEAGTERITSSRLVKACDTLNVDPMYFFRRDA